MFSERLRYSARYLSLGLLIAQLAVGCSSEEPNEETTDPAGEKKSDAKVSSGKDAGASNGDDDGDDVSDDADDADDAEDTDDDAKDPPKQIDAGSSTALKDAATTKTDASKSDAATTGKSDASIGGDEPGGTTDNLENFSFFVTSLKAMRELSKSPNGFGGDLRFGETGDGAGLRGADKICTTIAEKSMPGSGAKGWRAFLSTVAGGENGGPVHAKDRIGEGPWYDRLGRLLAKGKSDLINVRPTMADPLIKNDFPNEDGVPNHNPDGTGEVDNHDFLTGTNNMGELYKNDVKVTCNDWTKSQADRADAPRVGHSWPRKGFGGGGGGGGGMIPGGGAFDTENWMSALDEAGCGPSVGLIEMGPPMEANPTVGSGGGYGGIYCFALKP